MSKSIILLQLLNFQIRTIFSRYWEVLHGRVVLISILVLLLMPAAALSGYLHAWADWVHGGPFGINQGLALGFTELLNILVLMIHSKAGLPMTLRHFEMSLPIRNIHRRILSWTESVLIQLPSLFLLFIACLAEFLAYGRGVGLREIFTIGVCFVAMMTTNYIGLSFLQSKFPQFDAPIEMPSMGSLRIELRKFIILFKNRRRQFAMGVAFLSLLNALGWSIACVSSPDQPKRFLWTLIFGISLLLITPLTYALNSLDQLCESFISTLPTSMNKQHSINAVVSLWVTLPLLIQTSAWPIVAQYGWSSSLPVFLCGGILIKASHWIHRRSRKGFIPRFMILVLLIAWIAEKVHL